MSCCTECSQGKKFLRCSPPPPLCNPPSNGVLRLSGFFLKTWSLQTDLSRPDLSTLLLHPTLVLSLGLSFRSQIRHSTLALTNRHVSQVEKCMEEVPALWAGYSPSCLPQTRCCSPFLSSQTVPASIQYDLSASEETSHGVGNSSFTILSPGCWSHLDPFFFSSEKTAEVFCQGSAAVFL